MNVITTPIPGLLLFEPRVFSDDRGCFYETYQASRYAEYGLPVFVQDNISVSRRGVLRGLHLQKPHAQGKLVSVVLGDVQDVVVDLRPGSPTFGRWESLRLSSENKRQVYIPAGFAHGFCVLSEDAYFSYKCTDFYYPKYESGIRWNDPDLAIQWEIPAPIVSARDQELQTLKEFTSKQSPS